MTRFADLDKSDRLVAPGFNLSGYLDRIGINLDATTRKPDLKLLESIAVAQLESIPWENIDCVLGRAVDLTKVYEKLVHQRRGGYCFEHNSLLFEALKSLGYDVTRKLCRVIIAHKETPYTHINLLVKLEGKRGVEDYIVDVGFGKGSPPGVLKVGKDWIGVHQSTGNYDYRFVADNGELVANGGLVLQSFNYNKYASDPDPDANPYNCDRYWLPLYVCDLLSPVFDSQLTMTSYYVSSYLGSANWFTRQPVICTGSRDFRMSMVSNLFRKYVLESRTSENGEKLPPRETIAIEKKCSTFSEYHKLLKSHFGVDLSWDHRTGKKVSHDAIPIPPEAEFFNDE